MSNEAQSWAWKQDCGFSSDKSVLVALADNAWEDGSNAWPSVALLVRKTGLGRRTVQTSLRRLENNSFIEMTKAAEPSRAKPTTYRVCLDRDPAQSLRQVAQPRRRGAQQERQVDPAQPLRPPRAATAPEPLKNPHKKTSRPEEPDRIDVQALCNRLAEWLKKNGAKVPTTKSAKDGWRREARLLLDRDARPLDEALALVDWCQQDQFWHAVILSMDKFRKQYDQMRLKSRAPKTHEVDLDDEKWL